jgi:hypothetical protein
MLFYESDDSDDASPGGAQTGAAAWGGLAGAPPPSLPYKVDTSRPSLHTNWTRLVPAGDPPPAFTSRAPRDPKPSSSMGGAGGGGGGGGGSPPLVLSGHAASLTPY